MAGLGPLTRSARHRGIHQPSHFAHARTPTLRTISTLPSTRRLLLPSHARIGSPAI